MAHTSSATMEIVEMLCWYCLFGIHLKSFVYTLMLALFTECFRRKLKKGEGGKKLED